MTYLKKPSWLKSNKLGSARSSEIIKSLRKYNLHTVCESAKCPNKGECFDRGTATFMILGNTCTRNCAFCVINKNKDNLQKPDKQEPELIAKLSKELGLKHIVVTTVTRDDLPDGGASQFLEVVKCIRKYCEKDVSIELLISDFNGDLEQVEKIVKAGPDILNHNVETVPRLYSIVRPMANFQQSLNVLRKAWQTDKTILTKSGFMVGLGETKEEVLNLMKSLRDMEVDIVTIGQYMAPSRKHHPVIEYIHPTVFNFFKEEGDKMGFKIVESAPLVRSSFHAEKARKFLNYKMQINNDTKKCLYNFM